MIRLISFIATVLFLGVASLWAQATSSPAGAPRQKVFLVELFTSEGCSSYPPADALLRQINGTQPGPGELIVGISEHVTYWNSAGWRDPYSSAIYTNRQTLYGTRFGLESVYTPQMVVNGTEQFVGSDRASLAAALRKERTLPSSIALRILSVIVDSDVLKIRFLAVGDASAKNADILAVLTDDLVQSNVQRGENSGRTLSHVAVALSLQRVAKLEAIVEQSVQISLPSFLRTSNGHHLILFLQDKNNGRILGADSMPLSSYGGVNR
jgi:hypothetical protein